MERRQRTGGTPGFCDVEAAGAAGDHEAAAGAEGDVVGGEVEGEGAGREGEE